MVARLLSVNVGLLRQVAWLRGAVSNHLATQP